MKRSKKRRSISISKTLAKTSTKKGEMKMNNWEQKLDVLKKHDAFPDRTLLYGPPGTGKSSWPLQNFPKCERITLSEGGGKEDLLGMFILKEGKTEWIDGPATRAMRQGIPLILDEIDRVSPEVETILHALLDDFSMVQITLPDGEIVKPKPGYRVFGTTNADPTTLAEPVLDRFDLLLRCDLPATGAMGKMDKHIAKAVETHYAKHKGAEVGRPISVRRALSYSMIVAKIADPALAAELVFGRAGKEILSVLASHGA